MLDVYDRTHFSFPIVPSYLAIFIAYLHQRDYASSTVNTYISALGYSHRLAGVPDPTKAFFILEMLKGYGKTGVRFDSRLPITVPILNRICNNCSNILESQYVACMFRSMCAIAFYAFLRIGEITATKRAPEVLQLSQITKLSHQGSIAAIKVTLYDFKHHYNKSPISIEVSRQPDVCQVQTILDYINLRGTAPGPLFQHFDGAPVARSQFTNWLTKSVKCCGLDSTKYKGHSFRIGAASHAADFGYSDSQIRIMGRWKSDAFKKYIRLPCLSNNSHSGGGDVAASFVTSVSNN
jgi:hypothetical protein